MTTKNNQSGRYLDKLREIVLYGAIGGFCALLDSGTYVACTRWLLWNEFLSNFISVNVGITCSFFLNARLNFKKRDHLPRRAVRFYAVGYAGLLLSMGLLYVGVEWLHISDLVTKVGSIVVVAAFQYVLNSKLSFGQMR